MLDFHENQQVSSSQTHLMEHCIREIGNKVGAIRALTEAKDHLERGLAVLKMQNYGDFLELQRNILKLRKAIIDMQVS